MRKSLQASCYIFKTYYMDQRFSSLFNLTQEQAITLLDTPQSELSENDSRYIAASHLINFPTEQAIQALIRAIEQKDPILDNRIVRRKSVETLGRLKALAALPIIRQCLAEEDCYMVENAVWSIGEIGTSDQDMLEEVAQLLNRRGQTYRVIIHTLAKLNYQPALDRIKQFTADTDPPTASAAITAVSRLSGDYAQMDQVVAMLQHKNVLARRLSIQDLMDAHYYQAIPNIARTPVSLVFRLRAIKLLAQEAITTGKTSFTDIQPHLEQTLRDHPNDLTLVHLYNTVPDLSFLIRELYNTDFGRCYLATKMILEHYPQEAPGALFVTYLEEAHNDYGAHFHVMKLFGWLKHTPAYDLLIEALHNKQPQFQKSRAAAALALAELGDSRAIPDLEASLESNIWDLKYAILLAFEKLGDTKASSKLLSDTDWLVQIKAATLNK